MRRFTHEQLLVPVRAVARASGIDAALIEIAEDDSGTIHGRIDDRLVASGTLETVIVAVSIAANEHRRAVG